MMSRATEGRTLWWAGLTFFCVVSTALYLRFSDLARFELRSSGYIDQLLADFSGGREPLYLLLFVPSVLLTGALMSRKLRPWLEAGPAFCLFTLAAVVVPPQMVALARWPDGGGAVRSSTLLVISLAINTA